MECAGGMLRLNVLLGMRGPLESDMIDSWPWSDPYAICDADCDGAIDDKSEA